MMKSLKLLTAILLIFSFFPAPDYSQPVDNLLLKGIESGAEGKFKEAKDYFNNALITDPGNKNAQKYLSVIDDVIDKKFDEKAAVAYFKGSVHALNGQFESAISEYKKTVELDHDHTLAYMDLGDIYVKIDQHKKALSEYQKVKELEPGNIKAYLNRARIFLKQRLENLAEDEYNELVKNNPQTAEAYIQRGGFWGLRRKFDKAISDHNRAIELEPENVRCYESIGQIYIMAEQLDAAMSAFNKVIDLYPERASGHILKGLLYARNKNDCQSAIPELSKAIELYPAGADTYEFAEAFNFRGICYSKSGMYDKALSDATKKIELSPEDPGGYYNRGIHYHLNGQIKEACIDWKYACSLGNCNTYIYSRVFGPCNDMKSGYQYSKKTDNDFQLLILSKDYYDLNPGRDKETAFKVLRKKGNKNHLFTITAKDIENYDWDLQTITLTEKATRALSDTLNKQGELKDDIKDMNELRRSAGYKGSNTEFSLEKKCFIVKYKNKFVYGGIFLNVVSNLRFDYPVIHVLRSDNKVAFSILPVHIPFNYIDPADESGNIRKEQLMTSKEWGEGFIDDATEEKVHEIRKIIRDKRIKNIFDMREEDRP